jgi:arginyl-tRNA synthetase
MLRFHGEVVSAARDLRPSLLTKATYDLAKSFAGFYNHPDCKVLQAEPGPQAARAQLVRAARRMLAAGLGLMGIEPLEEM